MQEIEERLEFSSLVKEQHDLMLRYWDKADGIDQEQRELRLETIWKRIAEINKSDWRIAECKK